jgi:membrane protein DedA with SNARE-associated domain
MRLRRFLLLDLAGTSLWVVLIVGLGYAIGSSAVGVAHTITRYSLLLTLGLVLAVVLTVTVRALAPGSSESGGRPRP